LARGGAVYLCFKKNLLVCFTPKHKSKVSLVSRELRCRYIWMGQRFRGFLDLHGKVFFLSTMPRVVLLPQVEFFLRLKTEMGKFCERKILFPVRLC
jgi:hypothetical protein